MINRADRTPAAILYAVHNLLLAAAAPLYVYILISDIAYANTYQIQWKNFSSWLIIGALVFAGLSILCGVIEMRRVDWRTRRSLVYLLVLGGGWILGFINALVHAKDAWASMPESVALSIISTVLVTCAIGLRVLAPAPGQVA